MRDLVLRPSRGPTTNASAILNYCESDVAHMEQLLPSMLRPGATQFAFRAALWTIPPVDLPAAVERGRYMGAVARMEHTGIPIDVPALRVLQQHLGQIRRMLLARHAPAGEVFGPAAGLAGETRRLPRAPRHHRLAAHREERPSQPTATPSRRWPR